MAAGVYAAGFAFVLALIAVRSATPLNAALAGFIAAVAALLVGGLLLRRLAPRALTLPRTLSLGRFLLALAVLALMAAAAWEMRPGLAAAGVIGLLLGLLLAAALPKRS